MSINRFVKIVCLLSGMLLFSTANAYNPPIGIPAPSFGIDEVAPAAPAAWPSSQASGFYYIDNSHPNATDSNNTYGYPDKPRVTVPNGFSAGSYIELHGGPYTTVNKQLNFNCTASQPCWFRGPSSSNMPTITGTFALVDSTYVIMENMDFNGGAGGAIGIRGQNSNHISVRNSSIQNKAFQGNSAGVSIVPALGGTVNDIVIYNVSFKSLGDYTSTVDQDFHGVGPSLWNRDSNTSLYNVWLLDSYCYRISGNCIQPNGGNWTNSGQYLHHIYAGRNVSHDGRQAGFWTKQARDVVYSQNTIYNNRQKGAQPGDGMGYQYGPDNLWYIYNHIYNCNYGIRQSDTSASSSSSSSYIIGNVIHDIHPESLPNYNPNDSWRPGTAISLWHGNMTRYIVDNTIYDAHNGITSIYNGPVHISGNTISEIDAQGTFIDISHAARNGVASIDHSNFFDTGGDFLSRWNFNPYSSMSALKAASGQCNNCLEVNPSFVNATIGENPNDPHDFSLSSTSPLIGVNNDLTKSNNTPDVYAIFQQRYGLDIRKDTNNIARPATGRSIGAYESSNTVAVKKPNPPSNIQYQIN